MGLEFHAIHNEDNMDVPHDSMVSLTATSSSGAQLPSRYWHPLLNDLNKKGHHKMLLEVVDSMRDVQVNPDKHCRLRAVRAALALGRPDHAMRTVDDIRTASASGLREEPDSDIYAPILRSLARDDMPTEVVTVITQMDKAGIPVDNDTWKCIESMRRFDMVLESLERSNRSISIS